MVPVMFYAPVFTDDAVQSVLHAMALYVAPGLFTVIADEYTVPVLHVGVLPSLV